MLTAVDILFEKINEIPFQSPDAGVLYDDIIELYKEAKELEKQQIIEAHGSKLKLSSGTTNHEYWFTGEDYYTKKFKTC